MAPGQQMLRSPQLLEYKPTEEVAMAKNLSPKSSLSLSRP